METNINQEFRIEVPSLPPFTTISISSINPDPSPSIPREFLVSLNLTFIVLFVFTDGLYSMSKLYIANSFFCRKKYGHMKIYN